MVGLELESETGIEELVLVDDRGQDHSIRQRSRPPNCLDAAAKENPLESATVNR